LTKIKILDLIVDKIKETKDLSKDEILKLYEILSQGLSSGRKRRDEKPVSKKEHN